MNHVVSSLWEHSITVDSVPRSPFTIPVPTVKWVDIDHLVGCSFD